MRFATSGSAQLAYDVSGEGPDVLLIHAGVNDRRGWGPLLDHLGGAYRAASYDMRGFGETEYDSENGWSPVSDALAVIDSAGMSRPVVIGCSLGGRIALDLALTAPDRVGGLVLIAPGVSAAPAPEFAPGSPTVALIEQLVAAEQAGDLERAIALEARMWLDGPAEPEGRVGGATRELFLEMDRLGEQALSPGEPADSPETWPRLQEITCPALVLCGRLDVENLQAQSPEVARRLPHGRFAWLEGVAHVPHLEGDPATLSAISDFLGELSGVVVPSGAADVEPSVPAGVRVFTPNDLMWQTRPHGDGEPARHVAELLGPPDTRVPGNLWRYEPGAAGRRHRHPDQEETFVVLAGTLSMYLGDDAARVDVPAGGVLFVPAGTALQSVNHGDVELLVYAYGFPPDGGAELVTPEIPGGRGVRNTSL